MARPSGLSTVSRLHASTKTSTGLAAVLEISRKSLFFVRRLAASACKHTLASITAYTLHVISSQARTHLVDARRIADGKMVYIKRVQTDDGESSIASYLSGDPFQVEDPRNHSVPVLDYFKDDVEPSISYMVMPFLSSMNEPEFETVGEIVDFCSQMLEVCMLVLYHNPSIRLN